MRFKIIRIRAEGPTESSPGQRRVREPSPWVNDVKRTLSPERAKEKSSTHDTGKRKSFNLALLTEALIPLRKEPIIEHLANLLKTLA